MGTKVSPESAECPQGEWVCVKLPWLGVIALELQINGLLGSYGVHQPNVGNELSLQTSLKISAA